MMSLPVLAERRASVRVMPPNHLQPVAGHIAVAFDKLMLVWGGYYMNYQNQEQFFPPNKLLVYDSVARKWFCFSTTGDAPKETTGACGVIAGAILYVFGGFCDHGYDYARLYALDLRTLVWRHLEPASPLVPSVRHKLVGWHYDDKLYFFGGFGPPPMAMHRTGGQLEYLRSDSSKFIDDGSLHYSNSWNNQLISFNLQTLTWELVPLLGDAPSPRAAHSAAYAPETSTVLVFGGRLLDHRMNDMYKLDLPSMTWSKVATNDGPRGRSWHTTVTIDSNHMLLFGGFSQNCVPLDDTWLFNIEKRQWTLLDRGTKERPRLWHTAVSIDRSCYVFGGCKTNIFAYDGKREFSNELIVIDPSPQTLQQLCLNYVSANRPRYAKRVAQLPVPLHDTLHFSSSQRRQKSVKTPMELLRI